MGIVETELFHTKVLMLKEYSSFLTQIFEAYGQTECSAGCTFSMPGDWTTGMVADTWKLSHSCQQKVALKLRCSTAFSSMKVKSWVLNLKVILSSNGHLYA